MQQKELADRLERAAKEAAGPIRPGMSIQMQINAACKNLGYSRGHWRVRDAWYGYGGTWQAAPAFEFLERLERYKEAVAKVRAEKSENVPHQAA